VAYIALIYFGANTQSRNSATVMAAGAAEFSGWMLSLTSTKLRSTMMLSGARSVHFSIAVCTLANFACAALVRARAAAMSSGSCGHVGEFLLSWHRTILCACMGERIAHTIKLSI
jgi:hypothetical protein